MKRVLIALTVMIALSLSACKTDSPNVVETVQTSEGEVVVSLPKALSANEMLEIVIPALSWEWTGYLYYRNLNMDEEWTSTLFWVDENQQMVSQPQLSEPPAVGTKIEYYVELSNAATGERIKVPEKGSVVVEFK